MLRLALVLLLTACSSAGPDDAADGWLVMLDGTSLENWTVTPFGGEGPVVLEDGRLVLDWGGPLTGVTWSGPPLPTDNYEVRLSAERVAGTDFFCGLTFPVREQHATLILGGWGGSLCGISCIDGADASDNETMRHVYLETGRRFEVRLVVADDRIRVWLDGDPLVDVDVAGRAISLRPEVALSRPFGIASFATRAAIDDVRLRRNAAPKR